MQGSRALTTSTNTTRFYMNEKDQKASQENVFLAGLTMIFNLLDLRITSIRLPAKNLSSVMTY